MNTKLNPKFLAFLNNPVVLKLTILYKRAAEKAIKMDLILISPRVKRFSYLNLVMSFDKVTSKSFHRETFSCQFFLHQSFITLIIYQVLGGEKVKRPINCLWLLLLNDWSCLYSFLNHSYLYIFSLIRCWISMEQSRQFINNTFLFYKRLCIYDVMLLLMSRYGLTTSLSHLRLYLISIILGVYNLQTLKKILMNFI